MPSFYSSPYSQQMQQQQQQLSFGGSFGFSHPNRYGYSSAAPVSNCTGPRKVSTSSTFHFPNTLSFRKPAEQNRFINYQKAFNRARGFEQEDDEEFCPGLIDDVPSSAASTVSSSACSTPSQQQPKPGSFWPEVAEFVPSKPQNKPLQGCHSPPYVFRSRPSSAVPIMPPSPPSSVM